jgi:peptidoglycan-associated lipoprotein
MFSAPEREANVSFRLDVSNRSAVCRVIAHDALARPLLVGRAEVLFMSRSLAFSAFLVATLAFGAGCADKHAARPAQDPASTTPKAAATTAPKDGNIHVSDDILKACNIQFNDVGRAPKFNFDETALLPQDRNVLQQVATCLTTGPLKGRAVKLVGRTDSRGEGEYNMVLGEHRAGSTKQYLASLGVDSKKIKETSRGELDATGKDPVGWESDRRVDLLLQ